MLDFLKRLLGLGGDRADRATGGHGYTRSNPEPRTASNRYFQLLEELRTAKSDRDWEQAAAISRQLLGVTAEFVKESKRSYGNVPPNLPLFTDGARAFAMTGDDEALKKLLALTEENPALAEWRPLAEEARVDRELVGNIRGLLTDRPGVLQTDVKEAIGAEDGRKVATLLRQLEEGGEIQRIRYKRTYVLGLSGSDVPLPKDHPAQSTKEDMGRIGRTRNEFRPQNGSARCVVRTHTNRHELETRNRVGEAPCADTRVPVIQSPPRGRNRLRRQQRVAGSPL